MRWKGEHMAETMTDGADQWNALKQKMKK